ncbi:MAG: hypothetical protein DMG12_13380 [Acidobacteria bacterium]|nr:MAG: hypothetical protein DMG12_13380 [Acidobacteriota bacterium]
MTGAPESFQPRITARHQRSPRFFCRRSSGQGDLADAAGDNQPAIEVHFKIETDVYAAKLEETATEGTAGKPGWSEFRKETTAPNQNFPGSPAWFRVERPPSSHGRTTCQAVRLRNNLPLYP